LQNIDTDYSVLSAEALDELILQRERELSPFRSRMEELRLQFVNEFTEFAEKWFEEIARQYVVKYPEITLSLGKERLAAMKACVVSLQREAAKIVKTVMSDPKIWWHMEPSLHDTSQYEQLGNKDVGNRFPAKVDKPVRRVLGELGKILGDFGYKVTTQISQRSAFPEFWFSPPEAGSVEALPFYPHLLVWSEEMQFTLQKYNDQYKKAYDIYLEVEKLKEEKKKHQASQLWDST
jgi:hypothetical protein